MKTYINTFLQKLSFLLVFTLSAFFVQAADLSGHPGYLDLNSLTYLNGKEPNVEVNLYGPVLKMLTQLPVENYVGDNGETAQLLRAIDQVLVRIYSTSQEEAEDTLALISETSKNLESQNWVRIVRVREENDSSVDIHVKLSEDGENLSGLVIMAVEDKMGDKAEMVFVNIAGNFNPAYLANLGSQFDIDYLEGVEVP